MKDIMIFVSCHKNSYVPKNPLLVPVQTNAANASERFTGMVYDDSGDNISEKNARYCELTAQYWAWKNAKADYYGFFHYRRYLSFCNEIYATEADGSIRLAMIDDFSLDKLGLNEEKMRPFIESNDIITVNPVDVAKSGCKSNRDHYASASQHHIEHLESALSILKNKYPQYEADANEYLRSTKAYFLNIFIMRKELFIEYSTWLFDILFELDSQTDVSSYSEYEMRYAGFIAERLFGVYLTHLRRTRPEIRVKETEFSIFESAENPYIKPAFSENNVPVVLACNDSYSSIAAVVLQSILDNSSKKNNYDVIILENGVKDLNKKYLSSMAEGFNNVSIRFICVKSGLNWYKFQLCNGFPVDTFSRFLILEHLKHFHKCIYLDCDTVLNSDVAELFEIDVDGFLLGAVQDPIDTGWSKNTNLDTKEYIENVVGLENAFDYFNSGVMLINVKEFKKVFTVQMLFEIAGKHPWLWNDQDVLNHVCKGRVKLLPLEWNVMVNALIQREASPIFYAPAEFQKRFFRAAVNPKLVHYAGGLLPCFVSGEYFAPLFWKYARKTDYYEELLHIKIIRAAKEIVAPAKTSYPELLSPKIKAKILPFINRIAPEKSKARIFIRKVYNMWS